MVIIQEDNLLHRIRWWDFCIKPRRHCIVVQHFYTHVFISNLLWKLILKLSSGTHVLKGSTQDKFSWYNCNQSEFALCPILEFIFQMYFLARLYLLKCRDISGGEWIVLLKIYLEHKALCLQFAQVHTCSNSSWLENFSILLLTSAWCSSFCCRTSITNSAKRIVSSSFLAGVINRPTFSAVQELELKWSETEEAQYMANRLGS